MTLEKALKVLLLKLNYDSQNMPSDYQDSVRIAAEAIELVMAARFEEDVTVDKILLHETKK